MSQRTSHPLQRVRLPVKMCSVACAEQPELYDVDITSAEAASAIRESCLLPYLELELAQASFTDMGNRCARYTLYCPPHPAEWQAGKIETLLPA